MPTTATPSVSYVERDITRLDRATRFARFQRGEGFSVIVLAESHTYTQPGRGIATAISFSVALLHTVVEAR